MTLHTNLTAALHSFIGMSARLFATCSVILLTACGVQDGQLRISGRYKGQQQADFLLISTDGGLDRIDTLHIIGEEFDYKCNLSNDATFNVIYPGNALQLILWAHSGDHIKIDGSKDDLWHVDVTGNDENKLYTHFRQQCDPNDTLQLRTVAARIIREHPQSAVSLYLLTQYFIVPDNLPKDSIQTLYDVVLQAQPKTPKVVALGGLIKQKSMMKPGNRLPDFKLKTMDKVIRQLKDYKGRTLILYFWAGWQGNTYVLHNELARVKMEAPMQPKPFEVDLLSYSLDVDSSLFDISSRSDFMEIPTYFDKMGFESEYASQLNIDQLPLIIVVGPDGKIQFTSDNPTAVKNKLLKQ